MHYDDSSRRLNLLSGLVVGAALGAGLALLLLPSDRLTPGRRLVLKARRAAGPAPALADRVAGAVERDARRVTAMARRRFEL